MGNGVEETHSISIKPTEDLANGMLAFMRILILIFKPNTLFIFREILAAKIIVQKINAAEIMKQVATDIS